MSSRLKSRKLVRLVLLLALIFLGVVLVFWNAVSKEWTKWDYQVLDIFYRETVKRGYGPKKSDIPLL